MNNDLAPGGKLTGDALHQLIAKLYPIMRSITGPGVRESLAILQTLAPLDIHEVASGSQVLDWNVPDEWHFKSAWIADASGKRIIDSADSNLHVVNFSVPVEGEFTREQLLPHLHTLPDQPESIPYRTTYYAEQWGFCLSHKTLESMGDGPFQVRIDAQRKPGVLNYGELFICGKSDREVLVSTHICHPQLANDNLSGMVLAAALAASLSTSTPELSWRFVFVPGTIGAISWLEQNQSSLSPIVAGLVITGLGDNSDYHWKKTRDGSLWIDQLMAQVLNEAAPSTHTLLPFSPYGYDERQYCSPGFNLPVGRLTRGVHGTFAQYHTSEDNLDFVTASGLSQSLELLEKIAAAANRDIIYQNLSPYGEPQLGRRGLYSALGANNDPGKLQMSLLWLLNQSDGQTSLSTIAAKSGISMSDLDEAARLLEEHQLLAPVRHASAD
ncbi:DUF4910 domain-containing protein [Granulosicoccus antarcticus]|uniref:Polysaccharide biosynthesis protein with aminopeptidase-like domain protein n=1 Tax=Granulosicoccus antarcticus IMCC3135 TaxID=1192854 RepID=A0A2Z2P094_9GAMM|nr:DUF4910 domain-containing protein [Granulosicoccus antarcticus]ASJ74530.1 Putative polysaccharide biosynthesis protein with aminopeptidase-like domain protein [Granulosicoccus antarcticus IMCC3135]